MTTVIVFFYQSYFLTELFLWISLDSVVTMIYGQKWAKTGQKLIKSEKLPETGLYDHCQCILLSQPYFLTVYEIVLFPWFMVKTGPKQPKQGQNLSKVKIYLKQVCMITVSVFFYHSLIFWQSVWDRVLLNIEYSLRIFCFVHFIIARFHHSVGLWSSIEDKFWPSTSPITWKRGQIWNL